MHKRARAFTLIEILIVIAIIMLTLSFGFVSFFYYRERQELEIEALKLQEVFRSAQNNAKNGNRGSKGNVCNPTNISSAKLVAWRVSYNADKKTFLAQPVCRIDSATEDTTGGGDINIDFDVELPDNINFRSDPAYGGPEKIFVVASFASVLGTTELLGNPVEPGLKIILSNGANGYRFYLKPGGIVTTGCFCQDDECRGSGDNEEC